jgi:hypothetical protein
VVHWSFSPTLDRIEFVRLTHKLSVPSPTRIIFRFRACSRQLVVEIEQLYEDAELDPNESVVFFRFEK